MKGVGWVQEPTLPGCEIAKYFETTLRLLPIAVIKSLNLKEAKMAEQREKKVKVFPGLFIFLTLTAIFSLELDLTLQQNWPAIISGCVALIVGLGWIFFEEVRKEEMNRNLVFIIFFTGLFAGLSYNPDIPDTNPKRFFALGLGMALLIIFPGIAWIVSIRKRRNVDN